MKMTPRWLLLGLILLSAISPGSARAQAPAASESDSVMSFEDYEPKSTLVVPEHPVARARYPFIDVHNHQDSDEITPEQVAEVVKAMDGLNMGLMVNLSGGSGETFQKGWAALSRHPRRFVQFANVDFSKIAEPGFGERAARQLEEDVKNGARGLKVFKNLGMFVTDKDGSRVRTDDPRIDPVWAKCAELGIPVLIHTGEPVAFWLPWDRFNERWLELKQFPGRRRDSPKFASFEETMGEQHKLFRKHPKTVFINAHLGWLGHDLARLGRLLDEMPNVSTEIGAVLHELGRQPRTAREFLIRYQDRVLLERIPGRPRSTTPISVRWRRRTNISPTTGSATPSGAFTGSICRTRY